MKLTNIIDGTGDQQPQNKLKPVYDEACNENYHALFEQATDAIMVTDFNGDFKDVNSSFSAMFGYSKQELMQMNVRTLLDAQHLKEKPLRFDLLNAGESVHNERKMVHKNGTIIYVEANAKKFKDKLVLVIARDITKRKEVEQVLLESEANLHTILDTTDTIYVLMDTSFRIISYNRRAVDFVHLELGRTIGASEYFLDYFPSERRPVVQSHLHTVLGGKAISYESSYLQGDQSLNWYYVRMFPISKDDRVYGLMVEVSDITEKKLLEAQLLEQRVQEQKKIIRAIIEAQEVERNKIALELHDNVNQILSTIRLFIGMLEKDSTKRPDIIEKAKAHLDTAIREIRHLSREQVTPQKKFDLKGLIEELVKDLNENGDSPTRFQCMISPALSIDENLKLNIYRIIQEQTNNILQYACAANATIIVEERNAEIFILISDNGKGFDLPGKRKGIGISNIINRAESYNGKVMINSSLGKGCEISIHIPL